MAVGPLAQIERLDVGQHRIQTGKQREQHAAPAFLVAAALPVRFEKAREEPPHQAMPALRRAASTGQAPSSTRAPDCRAISAEPSVQRSRTTTISRAKEALARHSGSCPAASRATTSTERSSVSAGIAGLMPPG